MNGNKKFLLITAFMLIASAGLATAGTSATATVHFVVPSSYDFSLACDSNVTTCTFYHVENDGTINGTQAKVFPYGEAAGTNLAEGVDENAFSVTLTGTSPADINAYWGAALPSGVIWKISFAQAASGCGASNDTGYETTCSVTDLKLPPSDSTCKIISTTAAAGSVIAQSLASGKTQGFCFWADFSGVAVGDASKTLNIKSGAGT